MGHHPALERRGDLLGLVARAAESPVAESAPAVAGAATTAFVLSRGLAAWLVDPVAPGLAALRRVLPGRDLA